MPRRRGASADGLKLDSEAFAASALLRHVRTRMVMLAAARIQEPTHLAVTGQHPSCSVAVMTMMAKVRTVARTPTTTAVNGFNGDWAEEGGLTARTLRTRASRAGGLHASRVRHEIVLIVVLVPAKTICVSGFVPRMASGDVAAD